MIAYRAMLDVPVELARQVARLLAAERRRRGTRPGSRALTCFRQAVLILRWFRDGTSPARLARDFDISQATAYRYLHEALDVPAATAPDIHQALHRAHQAGYSHVILDGTLIRSDRLAETTRSVKGETIHRYYSGKHHAFGANLQFLTAPDGYPLWVSASEPGCVHDLTAARIHALPALCATAANGLPTLADKGYEHAGIGIHTPIKTPSTGQELALVNRTYNMLLVRTRCLGERAAALLKQRWHTLHHITLCPTRIDTITQAALTLTHLENNRTH